MTDALQGQQPKGTTFREQSNARRIGRARFLGHTAGYLVILALIGGALAFAGFRAGAGYHAVFVGMTPPYEINFDYPGLNPWVALGLSILGFLLFTDLTVRRRHDRNRRGTDAVIWQVLLLANSILHTFNLAPYVVGWLDGVLVLSGIYLFVVLVLLPGTRGPNRYGPDPRVIHRI
jgi:uncharacterized membrane protein YhaH (DUF805 family)